MSGIFPWIWQLSNSQKEKLWKSCFSLVLSGIFPCFGRKSCFLGWPGAGPTRVWGGFGNIWNQTQQEHPGLIPTLWNVPELLQIGIFPQNSLFGKGFSPLLPLEPGWGRFFFFWGGKIPNPRLWSSREPGINSINWIPVINWISVVLGSPELWKAQEWGRETGRGLGSPRSPLKSPSAPPIWVKSQEKFNFDPNFPASPQILTDQGKLNHLPVDFLKSKKRKKNPKKGEIGKKKIQNQTPAPILSHFPSSSCSHSSGSQSGKAPLV